MNEHVKLFRTWFPENDDPDGYIEAYFRESQQPPVTGEQWPEELWVEGAKYALCQTTRNYTLIDGDLCQPDNIAVDYRAATGEMAAVLFDIEGNAIDPPKWYQDRIAELERRIVLVAEIAEKACSSGAHVAETMGREILEIIEASGPIEPPVTGEPTDEQIERGVDVLRKWRFKWPISSMRDLSKAIIRAATEEGEG